MPKQNVTESTPLELVVATNVVRLRTDRGWSQERLAHWCRNVGLAWTKAQVAALELGNKRVMLEDAWLLAVVFRVPMTELLRATGSVSVGDAVVSHRLLAAPLTRAVDGSKIGSPLWRRLRESRGAIREGLQAGVAEAGKRAARLTSLGLSDTLGTLEQVEDAAQESPARELALDIDLSAFDVAALSFALWGHGLIAERDARASADATAKQRGHITRKLRREITEAARERGLVKKGDKR